MDPTLYREKIFNNLIKMRMEMLRDRASFAMIFIFFVLAGLAARIGFLMLSDVNTSRANLTLMSRNAISLKQLSAQSEYLKELTDHIDDVPLKEIKDGISRTVELVDRSNIELNAQYKAWMNIKSSMSIDRESYLDLKEKLSKVQSMQDQEIVRLNKLLDEAKEPSPVEAATNLVVSFFLGVLSSFMASALYPPLVVRVKSFFSIED